MNGSNRDAIIQADTVIRGEIRNGRKIEVLGYVEGELGAEVLVVHPEGRVYGTLKVDAADISGTVQGKLFVRNLMNIRKSADVSGNVQYGQLAMEQGGSLSAELRNVPPTISGDLFVTVTRGQSVQITRSDLTALDPDDSPNALTYTVSNPRSGSIVLATQPNQAVSRFTQEELEAGLVYYVHDAGAGQTGSFDVIVTDGSGATSGAPQTVEVAVRG